MILAHRVRLEPTVEQESYFRMACGVARFAWNWALDAWQKDYVAGGKPSAFGLKKQFNAIRHEQFPWAGEVHRDATSQPFAHLGKAFSAFSDSGFDEFRRQMEYKSKLFGTELIVADRWFASSKTCSGCGSKVDSLPLSVREWRCADCGVVHDRDVNAARNLATLGYRGSNACGEGSAGRTFGSGETALAEAGTDRASAGAGTRWDGRL